MSWTRGVATLGRRVAATLANVTDGSPLPLLRSHSATRAGAPSWKHCVKSVTTTPRLVRIVTRIPRGISRASLTACFKLLASADNFLSFFTLSNCVMYDARLRGPRLWLAVLRQLRVGNLPEYQMKVSTAR